MLPFCLAEIIEDFEICGRKKKKRMSSATCGLGYFHSHFQQRDLENKWNMWIERSGIELTSIKHDPFKNFDDFLSIYKSASPASKLEDGAKFYCFLEEYTHLNAKGCWTQRLRLSEVDKSWLYNVLALIEGNIDPQLVLGTTLSIAGNWAELTM